MAKLGEQLKNKVRQQQQGKQTRTQRVAQVQGAKRYEKAKAKFEDLQAQAKEIQETKFKDKVVQETYIETIPVRYDTNDYTRGKWYRKSGYARRRWMENASRNKFRGAWAVNKHTRTRDKVIPFTLEDVEGTDDNSYKDIYDTLSPDLKQFFDTPEVVLQNKATRIQTTKEAVTQKINETTAKITERKSYWDNKIASAEQWWKSKSSAYRNREGWITVRDSKGKVVKDSNGKTKKRKVKINRYRHKENIRDYEDRKDENIAELKGQIKGFSEGSQKLNANNDIDFASLQSYAYDVGSYEERKEEARNDARNSFNEARDSGQLREQFEKLGFSTSADKLANFSQYKNALKDYNKDVAHKNQLIKWAGKVGFDNISEFAQEKLNPDLVKWQKDNPNEKLIFKGIEAVGVESGSLQQSLSMPNYKKVTSPEYIYAEWEKKNAPAKRQLSWNEAVNQQSMMPESVFDGKKKEGDISMPFKKLTAGKELPIGYGSGGTQQVDGMGDIVAPSITMNLDDYNSQTLRNNDPMGNLWSGVKTGAGYVVDNIHYTGDIKQPLIFGEIKTKDKPKDIIVGGDKVFGGEDQLAKLFGQSMVIKVEDTRTFEEKYGMTYPEAQGFLWKQDLAKASEKVTDWVIGKEKRDKFKEDLKTDYERQYQSAFEQKYMKGIIFGETDFETASKEFSESGTAEQLAKQYEQEYITGMKELNVGSKFFTGRGVWGGVAKSGLTLAGVGVDIVSNPAKTGATAGVVYGGVTALGKLPTAVNTGISAGFFGYSAPRVFNPNLTFEERGGALITATISGASLGYSFMKWKNTPVIKRVKIKAPKMDLKSTATIGKDIKTIKDGTVHANKVVYKAHKLSQTGVEGYRTVVQTKGRVLSNKFWKSIGVNKKVMSFDHNAVYRGVPTEQLGYTRDFGFFRYTKQSGYEKATNLLKKYRWTNAQARATLRYTAPRVYIDKQRGIVNVAPDGKSATATFEQTISRPVISVDAKLGIKTRGGMDFKEITKVTRELSKTKAGTIFANEQGFKISGFVDKAGNLQKYRSQFELFGGKVFTKATNQKGFEYLGKQGGIDVFKSDVPYKDMWSLSRKNAGSIKLTNTRGGGQSIEWNYLNDPARDVTLRNTKLFNKIINLDKGKNAWIKPANIKKTPFPKYDLPTTNKPVFTYTKDAKSTSDAVKQVVEKIDKFDDFGRSGGQQSIYYGKGIDGMDDLGGLFQQKQLVLSRQEILQNQELLKSPTALRDLTLSQEAVKGGILIKELNLIKVLKTGNLLSLGSLLKVKSAQKLKTDVRVADLLKDQIKIKEMTALKQAPLLKTDTALKTQLKSTLDLGFGDGFLNAPKPPTIPKPPIIKTPPIIPLTLWLKAKKSKARKKGSDKDKLNLYYTPDFTSRALGLDPISIKGNQNLIKKLKEIQTGLEIRRPIKIQGNPNKNYLGAEFKVGKKTKMDQKLKRIINQKWV